MSEHAQRSITGEYASPVQVRAWRQRLTRITARQPLRLSWESNHSASVNDLSPDKRIPALRPICLSVKGASMAFTVIWYGIHGVVDQGIFPAEKTAKDHAISMFKARKRDDGVVSVEIRKDNGAVVFSYAEN